MVLDNRRQILEKHICQGSFSLCSSCEIGRLCLDPNAPFIWVKIRTVHQLSGNRLKGNSKSVFEGSFLYVPVLFLTLWKISLSSSQFGVILYLHFFLLFSFSFFSLLPSPSCFTTDTRTAQQDEAVLFQLASQETECREISSLF